MEQRRTEPLMSSFLHAKGAQLGLPIAGNFELTARCNFDCPMCYVHLSSEDVKAAGQELTAKQWIDIAREAKDRGMMFVLLTGGEPFVRKDFFEIYEAMKAMGLLISINSNGSMLEGEILKKLLDNPPFRINISLYGGCDETYRNMCGQDAFQRVVRNIRALKEAGVDVQINLSITPYNQQDLEKIYAITQELQLQVKASSYMYPPVRVNGNQTGCGNRLTPEEAAKCMARWDQLRFTPEEFSLRAQRMKELVSVGERECSVDMNEGVGCRAGVTSFWMTWDGRMMPCGMMLKPEVRPLAIGFGAAWDALRRLTGQIRRPSACAVCPNHEICAVCAAVCVTETGAFDRVPEYVCRQTAAMVKETWAAYEERKKHED